MNSRFRMPVVLITCLSAGLCLAKTAPRTSSLCDLQKTVAADEHINVRVSGIYTQRLETSELDDPACPLIPHGSTWVELALESKQNQKKLSQLIEKSGRASVVFDGELYGSPLPDPKLPEAIQKGFPPHWGHLNCCLTKIVVHVIREVAIAPSGKP